MNFEEILNQWETQTQHPYGKKRLRNEAKNPVAVAYTVENTQTLNLMDYWLRRYGVYDKDANSSENTTLVDNQAEKRRLRTMRPQAEIDLHGMTLEEAYGALVTFFEDSVRRDYQKILIIHGKGNHSQNGPVLARFVQKFLETNTHAGETGHPKGRDGGTGSTWVILK
ncbi:DNA mismatch repair protein MutS [Treponema medium]|uniref:Smr domain-containing protein n=2 Tax=Treponema medium TaxID=58231 RepID=A0AA87NNK6_TREMD|nr:Smr/MutS family protein [Treponema medium]EPF29786.1 hypothetical protein HMPREF9195_00491 [Treponema medium ATCC 700293]QSH91520.1 DNA mismatch repair protein MutS [Treponema medium]QSH96646.1 DNA mismatch repair protein MutS [Treponema medium]